MNDPAVVWRIRYQLPPTDPRFLAMTEEDILIDLLTLAYHDEAKRREADPTPPEADDPDAVAKYEERKKEVLQGDLLRKLAALVRGRPEGPRVVSLNIHAKGWG